jgi:hypothetical protein
MERSIVAATALAGVAFVGSAAPAAPASPPASIGQPGGKFVGGERSTARDGVAVSSTSPNGGNTLSPPPTSIASATARPRAGRTQSRRPSAPSSVLDLSLSALGHNPVPLLAFGMGLAGLALWRAAMRN